MLTSFLKVIEALFPIIAVWVAAGAMAKWLGQAESVGEGMKKIVNSIIEFVRSNNTPQNQVFQVPEEEFSELTKTLSQFFGFLIFESAYRSNDFLQLTYCCGQCKTDLSIINAIFQKFLRNYFNMPAGTPLATFTQIINGHLVLVYGFSETGIRWVQEQLSNQKSRQIPQGKDLTE